MESSSVIFSAHWRVLPSETPLISKPQEINATNVLEKIHAFPHVLKDDKRSLVKKGELFGTQVIAKQPRAQKGIESVKPICVLEHRQWGFLTDSWIIYEFKEGHESNVKHLSHIIELLQKLHLNGFRHDDPNFGNFLVKKKTNMNDAHSDELFLIDCKGKKRVGFFSDYYDFMLLSQRNDGVSMDTLIDKANIDTSRIGYTLALYYSSYKRKRTEFKAKRRARKKH